jgi:anti-sigma B factor antagonist
MNKTAVGEALLVRAQQWRWAARRPADHPRVKRDTMLSRVDTSDNSQSSATAFGIMQRELDDRTSVISVEGELDLSTAPRLKWMLVDSIEAGRVQVVIDLSLTTFIDSTAVGVLVAVNRSLDGGARLALVCTRPNVLKIFELSGIDGAFAIYPTLDEALTFARGQAARVS